jgi:hypothetical protein
MKTNTQKLNRAMIQAEDNRSGTVEVFENPYQLGCFTLQVQERGFFAALQLSREQMEAFASGILFLVNE